MRSLHALVLLVLGALLGILLVAGTAQATSYGAGEWELGMEWYWESGEATHWTYVDHHTRLQTSHGEYPVWMVRTVREDPGGDNIHRKTAIMEGTHLRAYDEATTRTSEGMVTVVTEFEPPAAYPMWPRMSVGGVWEDTVTTHVRYMVGLTPAGGESTTWNWTAWADHEIYELETPAGTFEGYNVSVYREEVGGDEERFNKFFFSHETRNFVATFKGGDVDFTLHDYELHPPPNAVVWSTSRLAETGENVTFYGHQSQARTGAIDEMYWQVPAGAVLNGTPIEQETRVDAENVTLSFEEGGTYALTLVVTDTHGGESKARESVVVKDRDTSFHILGHNHAFVEEPATFRLVPPDDTTVQEATWEVEGLDPLNGTQVEILFPRTGSYMLSVTYEDSEGNTGTLAHEVVVVQGSGQTSIDGVTQGDGDHATVVGPAILAPEDGTHMGDADALIVIRTTGLEDPQIVLPNGLRVPLDPVGEVTTERVPLPSEENLIRLQDGSEVVDTVTLTRDLDVDTSERDAATGANEAPFPWLWTLFLAPFLRRRTR